jgi:hypothetical protein
MAKMTMTVFASAGPVRKLAEQPVADRRRANEPLEAQLAQLRRLPA